MPLAVVVALLLSPLWIISAAQRTEFNRKQIFAFSVVQDASRWEMYPWDLISTIAIFGSLQPSTVDLVNIAHSHGTKAVLVTAFPVEQLHNDSAKQQWIENVLRQVEQVGADGVNLDTEDPIHAGSPEVELLTDLIRDLSASIHRSGKEMQVSVDVAWSPDCIDVRCYDYLQISEIVDYLFIMSYDTRSQIFSDNCTAGPNSAVAVVRHGVQRFLEIGVSPQKMILGLPWYGYDYPCSTVENTSPSVCDIKKVPFRGVACSDAAGRQIDFSLLYENVSTVSIDGRHYDFESETPFFWYVGTDKVYHQVWYDDVQSITVKANLAMHYELAGTGMWNVDLIYSNHHYVPDNVIQEMWDALAPFGRPQVI